MVGALNVYCGAFLLVAWLPQTVQGQQPVPAISAANRLDPSIINEATMHPAAFRLRVPHSSDCCPPGVVSPPETCPRCGVHCDGCQCQGEKSWAAATVIPWEVFAQGEYVGPARLKHVDSYRIRVDDLLDFVYRLTREKSSRPYELEVGDEIRIESLTAAELDRQIIIQPDGSVTLRLLGQVPAADRTLDDLRKDLDKRYEEFVKDPRITVTPVKLSTKLEELRATVDSRYGSGGQSRETRVTPEGTIQLPAIGSVPAQGLTLDELKREVDARYAKIVDGIEITPILAARAPRFIYVVGEVQVPGRFVLEGPTTVMQAIAMAGSWNVGAELREVVVFRRDENWRLMATRLDLRSALWGNNPCPAGEIWLRDSDIVLVPKSPLLRTTDAIDLLFTRGLYRVIPLDMGINFSKLSSI